MLRFLSLLVIIPLLWAAPVGTRQEYVSSSERRTAHAVLYEEDGLWGSIIFHQWQDNTPVIISLLFHNIKEKTGNSSDQRIGYAIHDEPVHYDMFERSQLCSKKALRSTLQSEDGEIGDLGGRHKMMHGNEFSAVIYDRSLSLFEGSPGYIVGKSFVIRQGDSESDHRCATIYMSSLDSLRPGAIPCEFATYSDCLTGAVNSNDTCVFSSCYGFRQYWGHVDHDTIMCKPVIAEYPKSTVPIVKREGVVPCSYGNYTLLKPLRNDEM